MRIIFGAGDAVNLMVGWEDTGVETKTFVVKDIQGPERITGNRIAGRAIGGDSFPTDIFKHVASQAQVFAKFFRSLPVNEPVPIAVAADLVTRTNDVANQTGKTSTDPTQHKECRLVLMSIEQIQQPACIRDHSAGIVIPVPPVHSILEDCYMLNIIDV